MKMTQEKEGLFKSLAYPYVMMKSQEKDVLSQDKNLCQIAKETESLRNEIRYYIDSLLPQVQYKTFIYSSHEGKHFAPFLIVRQFRMMSLLFAKRIKKYNLDPRTKLLVFFGAKCAMCDNTENLQLHHRDRDGKDDRATFEEYNVYIWQYYLVHLDEAVDRLKSLCPDCHDEAHETSGLYGFEDIFRTFFR